MIKQIFQSLLAVSCLLLSYSFLQGQDLAISKLIYPEGNQRVHLQYDYEIEFTLVNVGTTNMLYSTMDFDLYFDNQFYQSYNMTSPGLMAPGDSIDVTLPALTFATGNTWLNYCVEVRQPADINPANNKLCNDVQFSLDTYVDLKPVLIKITEPQLANDTVIQVGSSIVKMEAWVRNTGEVTLPRDFTIILDYKMYTKNRNYFGNIKTYLDTGSVFIVNMIGAHPDVQDGSGLFNVCVTVVNSQDQNVVNNEFCQKFYAIDFTGILENDKNELNSFVNQDQLTILSEQYGVLNIRIYNALGQTKHHQKISGSEGLHYINLSNWDSGWHVIKISDEQGELLHTNKFIIE